VKEAVAPAPAPVSAPGGRLASLDVLRGLIMVLMVLDHTRDFFMDARINPTNLAATTTPLFFTRWVTHFCAPLFIFLAGASAYLMRARGNSQGRGPDDLTRSAHSALSTQTLSTAQGRGPDELAWFLASRGLFLIVLELTVVRLFLFFHWTPALLFLLVFWSIGMSMILLGALVKCRVPARWIAALGAVIVLGHNLLDLAGVPLLTSESSAAQTVLVTLFLRPGVLVPVPGAIWIVGYPVLPWFGMMALGYGFGEVLMKERPTRIRITAALGIAAVLAFLVLRTLGIYGDPVPFRTQETTIKTVLAFLNCQKTPPSLLFVLMTLGPGLVLLAVLEATEPQPAEDETASSSQTSPPRRWLMTFGRVPLFFYLLQWPVIHLLANVVGELSGHRIPWFDWYTIYPDGHGYSLPFIYLMWAVVVVLLYFPSRWYAGLKRRRKDLTWLSYV
jgi:uncharacterized membrane protein